MDETMYSGVDLDAFTTALKGGNKSVSQPFDSAQLSQASNYSFNHSVSHWNDSAQNEFTNRQLQQDMNQREELHGSAMVGRRRQNPPIHSQRVQNEVTKSQYPMPTHNLTNVSRNSQAGSGRPPQSSSQIYRKSIISHADASHLNPSTASQVKVNSSNAMDESNLHGFQGMETETDLYGKRSTQINMKQERQYVYISPREISIYGTPGGINHHSLSGSNTNSLVATSSLKQQGLDTHMRHGLGLQSVGGAQLGTSTQCMDSFMQVKRNNINSSSGSTIFPSPVPRSITAQEETMYSDVDLDAFVDGNKSVSQPFDSAHLSQANNYISNHSVSHWNDSAQNEFTNQQLQQDMNRYQREEPHGSAMVGCRLQNPPILTQRVQNEVTKSQYPMPTHNLPNVAQNSQAGSGRPPQFSSQIYQKSTMFHADMSHLNPSPASQVKANSSNAMDESNLYGFQGMETETDLYRKRSTQINMKQERQYVYISPREISIYGTPGGINHRSLSGSNTNSLVATSSLKQQGLDTHMMQGIGHQSVGGAQLGTSTRCMNSFMEVKRNSLNSSSGSTTIPRPLPHSITAQLNTQIMHEISSEGSGNYAKIPPKKPSIRQKKPHNSLVSTAPQPSKKQKVSGSLADESIEQLNDVTAVSGVNLSEEEEQLFSGFMEDSRVSEESLRVVKEEEERLILQKTPLRNKLAEIMSKYGVKNMNGDVERCLSLGVEERMRVFLSSLIRVSKQRVDVEKSMHHTLVTSDIRKQIMEINQKAREEWDTKEFKAEKLQNSNEPEGGDGVDCDKEKENCRAKSLKQKKVNKEEDDKMRATAANDAARAAIGGGDMFSKWKLMAEQARRQKPKDISLNTSPSIVKASTENQDLGESGQQNAALVFGSSRKSVNSQMRPQTEVARSISVEDVISVLEREPQMSKSEVLYRLYEKSDADIDA